MTDKTGRTYHRLGVMQVVTDGWAAPPPGEKTYRVRVDVRRCDDDTFCVSSGMLPGLVTDGETFAEAIANAKQAFQAMCEVYAERGLRPAFTDAPRLTGTQEAWVFATIKTQG